MGWGMLAGTGGLAGTPCAHARRILRLGWMALLAACAGTAVHAAGLPVDSLAEPPSRAAAPVASVVAADVPAAPDDVAPVPAATLLVVRAKMSPPIAFHPTVLVNGLAVAPLRAGSFVQMRVVPGRYSVQLDWSWHHGMRDTEVSVDAAAGEYVYVFADSTLHLGFIGGTAAAYSTGDMSVARATAPTPEATDGLQRQRARQTPWQLPDEVPPPGSPAAQVAAADVERLLALLTGDGAAQKGAAIEMVQRAIDVPALSEAAKAQVLARYRRADLTDLEIDAVAWMCRAVAATARAEHAAFLTEVGRNASERKIRRHAQSSLERFYPGTPVPDD